MAVIWTEFVKRVAMAAEPYDLRRGGERVRPLAKNDSAGILCFQSTHRPSLGLLKRNRALRSIDEAAYEE